MFLIIRDIDTLQENVDQMPTGLMLIGNKKDLEEQNEREVSTETGETFAKVRENKILTFFFLLRNLLNFCEYPPLHAIYETCVV